MSGPVDLSGVHQELDHLRKQLCHCGMRGECLGCRGVEMVRAQAVAAAAAASQPVLMQIRSTNTSDDAIGYLATAATEAARDHTHRPPAMVLTDVLTLHRSIQTVLQGGRQTIRQSRELFRIDAGLLAHVCLLLGDVHRDEAAAAHAAVAILAADEAGSSPAEAYSAKAQIARWRHRYREAADLAAGGFACSPRTSLRVLLACQEANAAALARDTRRLPTSTSRRDSA